MLRMTGRRHPVRSGMTEVTRIKYRYQRSFKKLRMTEKGQGDKKLRMTEKGQGDRVVFVGGRVTG